MLVRTATYWAATEDRVMLVHVERQSNLDNGCAAEAAKRMLAKAEPNVGFWDGDRLVIEEDPTALWADVPHLHFELVPMFLREVQS